jgi:hypothetical protein
LTDREKEIAAVKAAEAYYDNTPKRSLFAQSGSGALQFPLTEAAQQCLDDFKQGKVNLAVLRIDIEKEQVDQDFGATVGDANEIPEKCQGKSAQEPRYALYNYQEKTGKSKFKY